MKFKKKIINKNVLRTDQKQLGGTLCVGGGKLLLFNKFSRNVITRQEHKMGGGLTWWGCLLLSYMHQNQKREREREPKK
jgi:hypothetical protein